MQAAGRVDFSVSDSDWSIPTTSVSPTKAEPVFCTVRPPDLVAAKSSVVVTISNFHTVLTAQSSDFKINEHSRVNPGPPPQPGKVMGSATVTLTTFPSHFFFKNLAVNTRTGSQLTPIAQIDRGGQVTLTWNASVTEPSSITIYYSNAQHGQRTAVPTHINQWKSPPLTDHTIFTVAVKAVDGDNNQPITLSRSIAVSVRNPDIYASSLKVNGEANISGTLSAGNISSDHSLHDCGYNEISGQGAYLQWNRSENGIQYGKTYLLNQKGKGSGGFVIGEVDKNNNVTPQVTINSDGDVGINTSTPTETLDVDGNVMCTGTLAASSISTNGGNISCGPLTANSIDTTTGGVRVGGYAKITQQGAHLQWNIDNGGGKTYLLNQRGGGPGGFVIGKVDKKNHVTAQVNIDQNGYVGVGITSPAYPLHIISPSHSSTTNGVYLQENIDHRTGFFQTTAQRYVSIRADGDIWSGTLLVVSDERIKTSISKSTPESDLKLIKEIEIVDYQYKDEVKHGKKKYKKVIGQQVEKVYPTAVSLQQEVVPDIFKAAEDVCFDESSKKIKITLQDHGLQEGETVKLIINSDQPVLKIEATTSDTFTVTYTSDIPDENKIFVYGRVVDDFRVVDYDAISMLNVSATQALTNKLEKLSKNYQSVLSRLEVLERENMDK
ncbi:MAG: tail fiber domain-containing protein [Candidatus Electrothrix sp. ATG2]|nr:tail fiber domain-containing protein [Candidatus Electrothrix sp. ATG2]